MGLVINYKSLFCSSKVTVRLSKTIPTFKNYFNFKFDFEFNFFLFILILRAPLVSDRIPF